jgi:hypothetical protein
LASAGQRGDDEVKQAHAPRLDSLVGRRVGFVSNERWQAYRMLPRLKSLLERDWAGIEVLPIDAFPHGNALIGTEETALQVKRSGVDEGLSLLSETIRPSGD